MNYADNYHDLLLFLEQAEVGKLKTLILYKFTTIFELNNNLFHVSDRVPIYCKSSFKLLHQLLKLQAFNRRVVQSPSTTFCLWLQKMLGRRHQHNLFCLF